MARTESWQEDTVFSRGVQINARVFRHEEHVVWGITERILTQLLALLEQTGHHNTEAGRPRR
jgi:hypothetical protein